MGNISKPKLLNFIEYLNEAGKVHFNEPVGLAVLGAPAGGKSHALNKIADLANDARIKKTLKKGVTLTVDALRDEFLSKDPIDQLQGFTYAFYLMKQKAAENEEEFGKWYADIQKLWKDKFSSLMPELKITVEDGELFFDGKPSLENLSALDKIDAKGLIDKLDKYHDYKRVVRYFQDMKQDDAVQKKIGVSYDEAGDEPKKIVNNMNKLHREGYVTDVFLIHPENVATNLIQNFFRVVTGGDGGRDSSAAIMQAYKDIEAQKDTFADNAEEILKVKSSDINQTSEPLRRATVSDDKQNGDKPIDVFVEVQPMEPEEAYKTFSAKLNPEQKEIFDAYLKYAIVGIEDVPQNAKDMLEKLTKDMTKDEVIEVFQKAADSKKYVFKFGGVTPELVAKVKNSLK